jgi:hypothetical protein
MGSSERSLSSSEGMWSYLYAIKVFLDVNRRSPREENETQKEQVLG